MTLKDLKMTLNEIKGGHLRDIYIIEHDTTYFEIRSDLKRLPSWFAVAIKYERNMLGDRMFKGFKV